MLKKIKYFFFFLLPSSLYAATLDSILNKTVTLLQGPIAKSVAIIAIICLGYDFLFTHRISKNKIVVFIIGLGCIFGAQYVYTALI